MDDPELSADRHLHALAALERVNRVSRAAPRLLEEVIRIHRRTSRPVRVLDVACGGGDVLAAMARAARRRGVPLELHGCDRSERALARASAAVETDLVTHRLDVLLDPLPGTFDVVTTNLFMHHLSRGEAATLLQRLAAATADTLLVQDLRRTLRGYLLAWVGLHTLTRSDVARVDGLRSVRAAFTLDEMVELCGEAGLTGVEIAGVWPQRMRVLWHKRAASDTRRREAA
jgi:2-polyprenyl-3-methyl-5-hydroxy-6-metoxy-1,4-benzoquinol methylase